MNEGQQRQSLNNAIKTVATSVAKFAPYKTGNLRNSIKAWNTIDNIVTIKKLETIIAFNFAPPGATYGRYWNKPTISWQVSSGKTKNIPGSINYASKGFHSYESKTALERYMIEWGKAYMIDVIRNELINKTY